MSDESRLLQAIAEAPDDDGPRLVYADWLLERGDVRGELIQLQCELARSGAEHPRHVELQAREQDLLENHKKACAGPMYDHSNRFTFTRGMITGISTSSRRLERIEEIYALAPLVDTISLTDSSQGLSHLARSPLAARVRRLDMSEIEGVGSEEITALLASPHLDRLEALLIGDSDSTPETAVLIASARLPAIRELYFVGYMYSELGDDGLRILASAGNLAPLEKLGLVNMNLTHEGAEALADSETMTRLKSLNLGGGNYTLNQIGPKGAAALASSSNMAQLQSLFLEYNNVRDGGVRELAGSPHLQNLRLLSLGSNNIGDPCVEALARSSVMSNVHTLSLSHNHLADDSALALARSPMCASLRTLYLTGAPLRPATVQALARSKHLKGLEYISLVGAQFDDQTIDVLIEPETWPNVQDLVWSRGTLSPQQNEKLTSRFKS